ncbi:RE1 [Symbiodinium necroappetens]|uniref:RE1 protein n=1 Tax=Symbiodinium necroappetens TaxID=1628268 RepID=A0A812Q269_9DINO|nr:RE1 [Symbiodinium necroappetens]
MASLLEGLSWHRFVEISESETTEGKYGIPRFDGSLNLLQEYSYRVRMRVKKEKEMDQGEVKKLGPLGLRLVEGLRGPALHIVRAVKEETLIGEKGPEAILEALVRSLRPRRQQEARELYLAGSRENGVLSRQHGEPMSTYILRRRTWYAMLTDLDGEIKLPDLLLAEQILMNAGVTEEHQLMIRTSLGQIITVDGVCNELVNQHGSLHLREKRAHVPWKRFGGKGQPWKGKWKNSPSYYADAAADETWHANFADQAGDAYLGHVEAEWDSYSQSLGGFESEAASGYFGYEGAGTTEHEYQEAEDPTLEAFAALVNEGLDEADPESAEYAADVIQAEAEVYFTKQRAQQKGHHGFNNKRFEVRGQLSLEERKARVTALKSRTSCRACGARGHWSGDSICPKGGGKGKRSPSSTSTSSTKGAGKNKGKGASDKSGGPKPRTVYFAVSDPEPVEPKGFMANRGDFSRVPPPTSLDPPRAEAERPRSSLDAGLSVELVGQIGTRARGELYGGLVVFAFAPDGRYGDSSLPVPSVTLPAASSAGPQWNLVPGADWDHEMLFAALRENSDVVMDQLLAQAQQQEQHMTAGPMAVEYPVPTPELRAVPVNEAYDPRAVPVTGPYDLPLLRPPAEVPAELPQQSQAAASSELPAEPPRTAEEAAHPEGEGSGPASREQESCRHERTTTKGTNKHYFLKTCVRCGFVLERSKKDTVPSPPAASTTLRDQDRCPHNNVTQAGTNRHVWKWYCKDCGLRREGRQNENTAAAMGHGALGGRNLEGPDTEAVKVLEMAGAVVMVQESGGTPVPLDKLPGIVSKCAQIYRAKHPERRAAPPPATTTPSSRPAPPEPPEARRVPADTGITGDAVLQSGKHKGKTYASVYAEFPDYVSWILSQGGNIQAKTLQDFERYIRFQKMTEHRNRAQANMAVNTSVPSEDALTAVLDTGCNQTCHGALWMKEYMKASGLEYEPLACSSATSLNGIGGRVRALGKRTLNIAIQLSDGTMAAGTVQSTELEDSSAPLLLSYGAQKQLGFVLDIEAGAAYSKVFQSHIDLVDRDGLPALRLLPLLPHEQQGDFAMMVQAEQEDEDNRQSHGLEDDDDHWQLQGDVWMRVHLQPRTRLYDPRGEPSQEQEIERELWRLPFRKTVPINCSTGERREHQGHWLEMNPEEVAANFGEDAWTGYTLFYRDSNHCLEEPGGPGDQGLDHHGFAAFDEEKPTTLTKGQRRHLQDTSEGLKRHDATLWAQLDPRPPQRARACQRLLPKGCRTLLLELFAGAAALTAVAANAGFPHGEPLDLMNHQLLSTAGRQTAREQIEHEDPYLLAVTSLKTTAERRLWYPVIDWIMDLVNSRLQKGREVLLEAPWHSLFWQLRCTEKAHSMVQAATQEPMEMVYCDWCRFGGVDLRTGSPVQRPTAILTSSRAIKREIPRECQGQHWHHEGPAQLLASWPSQLAHEILEAVACELQDLNCSMVFAAEEETEEQEEFGMIDGVHRDEDLGDPLPSPENSHEMSREERLDEEPPPEAQPDFEKVRKQKWLAIPRNKRLAIRRLHHMTGHASNSAMIRMLRSAGTSAEVVICDAFEVVDAAGSKHTILSLVDSGTKFHVTGRVSSGGTPSSKVCADFINTAWLSWAGNPKIFQADQGVHNQGQVASLMRAHGIEIRQAARQAPWQIGRGERHGGILKAMVKRLITAHQLSGDMSISAAVTQSTTVKNSMYNHDGYVPAQWVRRLPHDVTSLLGENEVETIGPQQETDDPETVHGKLMQMRQWAKECFIYLDSSQRIRRAMLRQTHTMRGPYQMGDLVSYHRRGRWYGPARVLSHEGKSSLWLVHGGMTLLVAETALRPATTEEVHRRQALTMRPAWNRTPAKRKYEDFLLDEEEDLPFEEETAAFDGPSQIPYFDFTQTPGPTAEQGGEAEVFPEVPMVEPGKEETSMQMRLCVALWIRSMVTQGLMATAFPEYRNEVQERKNLEFKNKAKKVLAFLGTRTERKYKKKVVKQGAGREINYQKADPELRKSLDETRAKEWSNWKKYSNMQRITRSEFEEMKKKDSTLRIIPTRWVDVDKSEAGKPQKLKSRFVVRGDLEDASSMRTDSPTGSQTAMGLLLSFGAATRRTIKSGDISAAFLQGSELDRKLVLSMPKGSPPEDMAEDDLVIVSTTVYGTKDAPRGWFKNLDTTLRNNQLRRVPKEPGFYVMNGTDSSGGTFIKGLLLVHVDDLLWVGDDDMEAAMLRIQEQYRFGSLDQQSFKFCGRWLEQGPHGIRVTCPELISRVRPVHLEPRRKGQRENAATEKEKAQLRSVVGSLNWLVRVCRPDLAYSVSRLQAAVNKPVVQDLVDANNLVKFVAKTKDKGLLYPAGNLDFNDVAIIAIQDASYAADYDTSRSGEKMGYRSQSGRLLCLARRDFLTSLEGHLYPIEWHSTIIRRVCKSTLQAESLSLLLGVAEGEHARAVLHGLYEDMEKLGSVAWTVAAQDRTPLLWVTDCMSLKEHLVNPAASSVSDKRLAIDLSSLRQELWREDGQAADGKTRLLWTSTDKMLADALTKRITIHGPLEDLMHGKTVSLVPTVDQKVHRGVKAEVCD